MPNVLTSANGCFPKDDVLHVLIALHVSMTYLDALLLLLFHKRTY